MDKMDCSTVIGYITEKKRMCENFKSECNGCPFLLFGLDCNNVNKITQRQINVVQKWSDEHPKVNKGEDR